MKFWLLNTLKFLAYISPFLLGFTFITVSAINGSFLKPVLYFGILALTTLILSLFKLNKDMDMPENYNELCKTWGWNVFNDAYYRPSLATYFITFTLFYTCIPMILNNNVNVMFIIYIVAVMLLDFVFNYSINKCYTTASYTISIFFGVILGSVISAYINSLNPELLYFGDESSTKENCGKVSKKNFKCKVYKNGQLLKTL